MGPATTASRPSATICSVTSQAKAATSSGRCGLQVPVREEPTSEVAHLLTNLADGLLLQLPDAFTREIVFVANLFQRQLILIIQTEAPTDDPGLDRAERSQ